MPRPPRLERLLDDQLEVGVLPELGGKICELRRRGGPNALLSPGERPYLARAPGDLFELHDASGFDECLPTVAPCAAPWGGSALPDHGDLWTSAWSFERQGPAAARMSVESASSGIRLERRLALRGGCLRLDYELSSRRAAPTPYLWSAHPLLAVSRGGRVLLPPEVSEVIVEWSRAERLGKRGAACAWPTHRGLSVDVVSGPEPKAADKLYAGPLERGECALWNEALGESLAIRWDVAALPFLGVWLCQGGWPEGRRAGDFTVALEPCNGYPDSLAEAVEQAHCRTLSPGEVHGFWLELEPALGAPRLSWGGGFHRGATGATYTGVSS